MKTGPPSTGGGAGLRGVIVVSATLRFAPVPPASRPVGTAPRGTPRRHVGSACTGTGTGRVASRHERTKPRHKLSGRSRAPPVTVIYLLWALYLLLLFFEIGWYLGTEFFGGW
jgi:hypothetical protein